MIYRVLSGAIALYIVTAIVPLTFLVSLAGALAVYYLTTLLFKGTSQ